MYNSITEEKIRQIPQIGNLETERLPQELTKIYAQIVTLRRQFTEGTIDFKDEELHESLQTLQTLAFNLETILITSANHPQRSSIAFVAATAHSLIYKMGIVSVADGSELLNIDTISSQISATVLFLIGNSQADAAEMATTLDIISNDEHKIKRRLIRYISAIARGRISEIINNPIEEEKIISLNPRETALAYLWRELGIGIYQIANQLLGNASSDRSDYFDKVTQLSISKDQIFDSFGVFSGPFHLSKLLKILERDILERGIIGIPPPTGVDESNWHSFLKKLAQERPYLWENHFEAVNSNFLKIGISSVLTFPTGAGKSTLSELKIASYIYSGKKVIYIVPTHALEDQVNSSLNLLFAEAKINTYKIDNEFTELVDIEEYPILVMTPERCLTLLNVEPVLFNNIGLVVFDEFHLIHSKNIRKDRRALDAMYCLVSLFNLIPTSDYLMISAMVENGAEIANWIENITQRECMTFNSSWKPTRQLHGCLIFEKKKITSLQEKIEDGRKNGNTQNPSQGLKRKMKIDPLCLFSLKNIWESESSRDYYISRKVSDEVQLGINNFWKLTTNRNKVASDLASYFIKLGLKTLVFVNNPKYTLSTAKLIRKDFKEKNAGYEVFFEDYASEIENLKLELGGLKYSYLKDGDNIGVHHGLLLPIERELIEKFFKIKKGSTGLIATATLAQGINLPAEVVIIAGDDRYDDVLNKQIRVEPHELLNAAGRAGRAGRSSQGVVILVPGKIVTIDESAISERWWNLKNEVFSKSDQCLIIEDPLEYFLDSIQDSSIPLEVEQRNFLYRFKSEDLSETETSKLIGKSFFAFKAIKANKNEELENSLKNLLKRRKELDDSSEKIIWTKEISYKTGVDPNWILRLGTAVDKETLPSFFEMSVLTLIEWFFRFIQESNDNLIKIFSKQSAITNINKAIGLKPSNEDVDEILKEISRLKKLVDLYVQGTTLDELNENIPTKLKSSDEFLMRARNFVIRLIPDISFAFGLLSMVLIEKSIQNGIDKNKVPWTIRALSSCIREGVDSYEKLFFKKDNNTLSRVGVHAAFQANE